MSEPLPGDKIQQMVSLVLEAVDQRLATVREQLVQITNNVARNHADLEAQIAECREFCLASSPGIEGGEGVGADAATLQLVEAANVLTERVTFLEARANQYTNDRIAELQVAIERLNVQFSGDDIVTSRSSSKVNGTPARNGTSNADLPLSAGSPARDNSDLAPAVARLGHLVTETTQPAHAAKAAQAPIDIEELSASINARLSAAIERAIGS